MWSSPAIRLRCRMRMESRVCWGLTRRPTLSPALARFFCATRRMLYCSKSPIPASRPGRQVPTELAIHSCWPALPTVSATPMRGASVTRSVDRLESLMRSLPLRNARWSSTNSSPTPSCRTWISSSCITTPIRRWTSPAARSRTIRAQTSLWSRRARAFPHGGSSRSIRAN